MNTQAYKQILVLLLAIPVISHAIDNAHFWRATNFLPQFYEPRLAKAGLFSFDATLGFGKTHEGRNGCDEKTELLNIYGLQNMQALGTSVPGKNLTNPGDVAMMQLDLLPSVDNFGQLMYRGKFELLEANFCATQNLSCGLFLQGHIPYRDMKIKNICFCDKSPTDCQTGPNAETPQWQTFLSLLPTILTEFNVCADEIKHTGPGDLTLILGWTNNYEETQELDYVDTTFRIGILIPTGKKKNEDWAFDIANGYNGHFGVPLYFDFAVGMYEWLTLGTHFDAIIFASKEKCIRMKTDLAQNGFIKLTKGAARVTPGVIFELNGYLKADHIVGGLSLFTGYSFAMQRCTTITPCQTSVFEPNIVCCDSVNFGWKMHTFQFYAEYDFSNRSSALGPRVGIFYNAVIGGQRIFNTNMGGGYVGLDIAWCF
jgi:hypothetical protein